MLRWHRWTAGIALALLAYIAFTGTGIQMADMRALLAHAPETDPDMRMMRQHIYGPPNYAVVSAPDYTAPALPAGLDYVAAIRRAAALGRAAAPGEALRLVELRTVRGRIAAHVQVGTRQLMLDLASGAPLPAADLPPPQPGRGTSSPRADFKYFHRFNYLGGIGPGINGVGAIAFFVLIVTGLVHYVRLYRARARMGREALFWRANSWWRTAHRWTAIVAAVLVLWLSVTGFILSADNIGALIHTTLHGARTGDAFEGDQSSPLADAQLPAMTRRTLAAFRAAHPATGIKVLRLRYFVGYPQGVVIAADADTSQFVYNADTGAAMRMWEKGYPDLGFPSGWEWHQRLKQIHRGDMFGMTGRWLGLLGGLSMLFLLGSGGVMYYQLWQRRRTTGRPALLWT